MIPASARPHRSMLAEEMGKQLQPRKCDPGCHSFQPSQALIEVDLNRPGRMERQEIPDLPHFRQTRELRSPSYASSKTWHRSFRGQFREPRIPSSHCCSHPTRRKLAPLRFISSIRTSNLPFDQVLLSSVREYQNPVPRMSLCSSRYASLSPESSDLDFIPALFRPTAKPCIQTANV